MPTFMDDKFPHYLRTLTHKNCGGKFLHYEIREHHYCFMRCDNCGHALGGEKTEAEIKRLMQIKVRPTIRRA